MSVDRWQRLEAAYHEALARPPDERASFLDHACAGNEDFRRELEQLLAWDARAGTFLDGPLLTAAGEPSSAFSPAHDPELAPDHCIGSFRIVRHLGRGGMGRVQEAVDLTLQRRVALKLLSDAPAARRHGSRARVARSARSLGARSPAHRHRVRRGTSRGP